MMVLILGWFVLCLVSKVMLEFMWVGLVLVDLVVECGGNVEGVKFGKVVMVVGVKVVGYLNMVGWIGVFVLFFYVKNLFVFFEMLIDKEVKVLKLDFEDELV